MSDGRIEEIILERREQKVKIGGKMFTAREMDGMELAKYREEMGDRARFNANGQVVGMKNYLGVEAALISKCLYDETGKLVAAATITNWPVSAQQKLMKICQRLNGLDDEAEEESKKG